MKDEKQLISLINQAYNQLNDAKFHEFRRKLSEYKRSLTDGKPDYYTVIAELNSALFKADPTLPLTKRISGLPSELIQLFDFVNPQANQQEPRRFHESLWENLKRTLNRIPFFFRP